MLIDEDEDCVANVERLIFPSPPSSPSPLSSASPMTTTLIDEDEDEDFAVNVERLIFPSSTSSSQPSSPSRKRQRVNPQDESPQSLLRRTMEQERPAELHMEEIILRVMPAPHPSDICDGGTLTYPNNTINEDEDINESVSGHQTSASNTGNKPGVDQTAIAAVFNLQQSIGGQDPKFGDGDEVWIYCQRSETHEHTYAYNHSHIIIHT